MPQTEFFDYNLSVGLSKAYESPYNQILSGANDYLRALMEAKAPTLPEVEKVSSSMMIGSANEFEDGHDTRNHYWSNSQATLGEYLNAEIGAMLFHQALGGGVTDTPVAGATGAHDHTFGMSNFSNTLSTQVLSRNVIMSVGSINYIYVGMGVNDFTLTLENDLFPKWAAQLAGSGLHVPLENYPTIVLPALETQIPFNYMHSAGANLQFTGTQYGGLYVPSSQGRFRGLNISIKNNLLLAGKERQPTDPFLATGDALSGAVQNKLRYGRRAVDAQLTLLLDNLRREYTAMKNNEILTNLTVTLRGPKIGATTASFEWEIIIPRFQIMKLTPGEQNGDEVITLDLKILKDTVTGGLCTGRIRNNNQTGIISLV